MKRHYRKRMYRKLVPPTGEGRLGIGRNAAMSVNGSESLGRIRRRRMFLSCI